MSLNRNLNEEMKHTLFDISLNHMRTRKSLLSLRNASHVIVQYGKLFYGSVKLTPTEQLCQQFLDLLNSKETSAVDSWLDSLFADYAAK